MLKKRNLAFYNSVIMVSGYTGQDALKMVVNKYADPISLNIAKTYKDTGQT